MAQRTRYQLDKVMVQPGEERASTWTFGGEPVSGIEQTYLVRDTNFPGRNVWAIEKNDVAGLWNGVLDLYGISCN